MSNTTVEKEQKLRKGIKIDYSQMRAGPRLPLYPADLINEIASKVLHGKVRYI